MLAASAWAARRRAFAVPWLLWALAAACAMAVGCGARALAFQSQALAPELEGQDLRVTGIVAAMPEPAPWGLRFRFAVEHAVHATKAEAVPVQLPPLIDLTWQGPRSGTGPGPMPLSAGERWAMTVRLKAPHGLRNPHGFDQELWLWEQGVQATGYVRAGKAQAPPQRLQQTWSHPVALLRQRLRDAIVGMRAMPWEWAGVEPSGWQRARGVVAALVVGDQQAIERSDWELFRATGVAHLMSISGLHITLFAWLAAALLGWTWRLSARCCLWVPAPTAALVGGVLLALAYSALSGWGVPAQRTVTMLAVVAGLRLAGVRWPWYQTWLLALAAVVLADPWALWQAGFWLSFVAVGVLFASAARTDPPAREVSTGRRTLDHLRSQALALLRAQAVVTLALTPLGLLLFGQVSLVGVVANLLAIPWVTLVVTPLALLGMGWAPLWQLATASVVPLHAALAWLAQMPAAQLFLPAAPLWAALAAIAGGIWLVLRLPWSLRLLGLPLLLPALSWLPARPAPGSFTLLAADIGQGNAVLVRTRSHSLLYDSGPRYGPDSDAGQRVLLPLLRAQGERLDMLMLSHGDNDHTGGAASVQRAQPQAALRGAASPEWPAAVRQAAVPCAAGQRWAWDGVAFEVLHPLPAEAMAPLPQRIGAKGRTRPTPAAACCASKRPMARRPCSRATSNARRSPRCWRAQRPARRLAAGAAPRQQDLVERRMDCRRVATPRAGAGRLPQPLRPPRGAGRAALPRAAREPAVEPRMRRRAVVFGAAAAGRLRARAPAALLAGRGPQIGAPAYLEDARRWVNCRVDKRGTADGPACVVQETYPDATIRRNVCSHALRGQRCASALQKLP
ncbi:DNA internalization-related competence protein ComEC/Rec2 [Comamonas endophytica]|uniref:DNA internalization-related competence protein ComEC/Rec2 n=1 Tax=Comamonas endophytica TaxID=2949090 RepID=UPI00361AA95F